MKATVVAIVAALTLTGCGGDPTPPATVPTATGPQVHVVDAELRLDGDDGLLVFAAHNAGTEPDTLSAASCTCSGGAEVVGDATIRSEQTMLFGPRRPQVDLTRIRANVHRGDLVDVVLTFANAGDVTVTAEVVGAAQAT